MEYWGKHYLLDCKSCDIESIQSKENIAKFVTYLIHEIDMIAYGAPIIERFATHDIQKGGITLSQMISTSLIDGHFVDFNGDAYISVHSCKDFDEDKVKNTVKLFFNPSSIKEHTILRQA